MLLLGIIEEIAARSYSAGNIVNPCCNSVLSNFVGLYLEIGYFNGFHNSYMCFMPVWTVWICMFSTCLACYSAPTKDHKSEWFVLTIRRHDALVELSNLYKIYFRMRICLWSSCHFVHMHVHPFLSNSRLIPLTIFSQFDHDIERLLYIPGTLYYFPVTGIFLYMI
jgi:hypothetical protein